MKLKKTAFTLIELLVVLAITAFVAAILLPALAATRTKSLRINCLNNLKQVGLAARLWQEDNYGLYPMAVSRTMGGANEYLAHENTAGSATPSAATSGSCIPGLAFLVMSNELSTAKILWCPSDNIHTINSRYATNFSYQDLLDIIAPAPGQNVAGNQPGEIPFASPPVGSKISYFVNADAVAGNAQDILTGDDNIGSVGAGQSTPASYRFGGSASSEIDAGSAANGTTCLGITTAAFGPAKYWSWTASDFHQGAGNLAFADGSCQQATIPGLHYYLNHSTNEGAEAINFMP